MRFLQMLLFNVDHLFHAFALDFAEQLAIFQEFNQRFFLLNCRMQVFQTVIRCF